MKTKQINLIVEYPTHFFNDIRTAYDKIIEVAKEEFSWYRTCFNSLSEEYEVIGWSRKNSDKKGFYKSNVVVTYTVE